MNRNFPEISSLQNPKIKGLIHLRDRSERDTTHRFLIEGYREILRAFENTYPIEHLYICPKLFLGSNENALIDNLLNRGVGVYTCTENVFRKISYRDRPDGLIAVGLQQHLHLENLNKLLENTPNPLLVVAESIEKPGNLGTILRSTDAVGADALIVCDRCTDIHNPNVIRASVGTLFSLPVLEASGQQTLEWLKQKKIQILAATPSAKVSFTQVDMRLPLAIVVGTEQLGLSDLWMKNADLQVKIPMMGAADSLNVAMATTLLLYEALRQRS